VLLQEVEAGHMWPASVVCKPFFRHEKTIHYYQYLVSISLPLHHVRREVTNNYLYLDNF